MVSRLRALRAALLIAGALGATNASAAQAFNHVFDPDISPAVLTAAQTLEGSVFGVKSGALEVKCSTVALTGTTQGFELSSVTLHPSFSGCSAEPFGLAPVDTSGCDFVLRGATNIRSTTTGGATQDAPVDIECTSGSSIQVTAPGCTITIGGQNGLQGVTYTNEGSGTGADLKVKVALDKIKYTTPGGFICSLGGLAKSGEDGFVTGGLTLRAFTDKELNPPVAHQEFFNHGQQLGIRIK